jgi:hypothetical protein
MRELIIALPPVAIAAVLFVVFAAVSALTRRVVRRRFGEEVREELADQANNLLTGVSATFAFFIGFAISICWGAVTAGQSAVEQHASAIHQMAFELRNIPDAPASAALMDKLKAYARTAADQDDDFLARGDTTALPSAAKLEDFEDAVNAYAYGPGSAVKGTPNLLTTASSMVSSSASVSAVANRALPRPLAALLFIVAVLVTVIMGLTTVTSGRANMIFVYVWCVIPALSLTVVLALAFPFALRSGMTVAPLRAVAGHLAAR